MGTVKLKAVPSSSTTEHTDASWHHSADHPHPGPGRRAAHLGLQPELGLCPERRAGSDRRDPDHPLAHGPPLTADRISTRAKGAWAGPFLTSACRLVSGRIGRPERSEAGPCSCSAPHDPDRPGSCLHAPPLCCPLYPCVRLW